MSQDARAAVLPGGTTVVLVSVLGSEDPSMYRDSRALQAANPSFEPSRWCSHPHGLTTSLAAGALSSFVPDSRERRGLMESVGEACEQQGQLEQARELYLAAPSPCPALRIMNRQLSDLIPSALTQPSARKPCLPLPAATGCCNDCLKWGWCGIAGRRVRLATRCSHCPLVHTGQG